MLDSVSARYTHGTISLQLESSGNMGLALDAIQLEEITLSAQILGLDCELIIGDKSGPQEEPPRSLKDAAYQYRGEVAADRLRRKQGQALVRPGFRPQFSGKGRRGRGGHEFG